MPDRYLRNLSQLRLVVLGMEAAAGLDTLTEAERSVLCALAACQAHGDSSATDQIRGHPLSRAFSEPTFHRALRQLLLEGYVERVPGRQRGRYRLGERVSRIFSAQTGAASGQVL